MYMVSYIAYHGDIIHYLSVELYSTEPPEETRKRLILFVYKGFKGINNMLGEN